MDLLKFAQGQNLPSSSLYVVATPIGNLADISIRALYILNQVDGIACEDKRHSSALLEGFRALKQFPLNSRTAEQVCTRIKGTDMQVRRVPGTALANQATGEVIYTPPCWRRCAPIKTGELGALSSRGE